MNKENIIYTGGFIIFKGETGSWKMGNYLGKTIKEIEELEGKEIKQIYDYVQKKKIIYKKGSNNNE